MTLLEMNDPQAIQLLGAELADAEDTQTRRLIATALVLLPHPPPVELAPVLSDALLNSSPPDTQPLAGALGRYTDDSLTRNLASVAANPDQPSDRRHAAILALGHHRTTLAAGALIALIEPDAEALPDHLEQAVFTALESLSGRSSHVGNRHHWITWWQEHRHLSDREWFSAIAHNLTIDRTRIANEKDLVLARLVDTQRRLYRSLPQPDRPEALVRLLGDPLVAVRQLAIDLCVQRLIDTRPIGPEVLAALHPLLNDSSVDVRRRATQLAHDLADEPSAKIVARRVMEHADQDVSLLQTQLRLLARLPQPKAIPRALDLLEDSAVADDAAGFLAYAAEKDLLHDELAARAADLLRDRLMANPTSVRPQYVTLIAHIGTTDDWDLIEGWLDSDDESVKLSAARVWANSSQPLQPLLDRTADPIIQPIVVTAARQRGKTAQTLLALLDHTPNQPQAVEGWERALLAIAGRVSTSAVIEADGVMAQRGVPLELREKILTAAIDRRPAANPMPSDSPTDQGSIADNQNNQTDGFILSELLLTRAAIRQSAGKPARALEDYERVHQLDATLSSRLSDNYQFGRLDAYLATGRTNQALKVAEQIIRHTTGTEAAEQSVGRVVDLFIKDVQRNLNAQELDRSRLVLAELRKLLDKSMSDLLNQRLAELEDHPPVVLPPAPPVPGDNPTSPPNPASNKTS